MHDSPFWILLAYSLLVLAASLAGGWIPTVWRWNHRMMQGTMSFVGGVMLGIALLHLLPHSVAATGSADQTHTAALLGLVTIFLLIRVFRVHQHPSYPDECGHAHDASTGQHWHDELDAPLIVPAAPPGVAPLEEAPSLDSSSEPNPTPGLSWIGLFAGMTLHTMLDGVALAASVSESHGSPPGLPGLGAFVAVFLHKPLDALSITSLMAAGGWSHRWQRRINYLFALFCPATALAFYLGVPLLPHSTLFIGLALGFSAGVFLCISLADILPEIQFHAHDRLLLTALLIVGLALAWLLGLIEPAHLHGH